MGVIDDEQQIALPIRARQRCPGRPQERGGLSDVGDINQVAECPERDHALSGGAGDPVDVRGRMAFDNAFRGQSGQRGFAAAVGSEHDGAGRLSFWPRALVKRNVQLLQGGRMLRNIPSNRHCRILWRATPVTAQ